MSMSSQLRLLLKRWLVTPSDFEAFLLDNFKDEVHSRRNLATADRTSLENLLLQLVPAERIVAALEDWADRSNQPFSLPPELGDELGDERRGGRPRHPAVSRRAGLLERVRKACELRERKHSGRTEHPSRHAAGPPLRATCLVR